MEISNSSGNTAYCTVSPETELSALTVKNNAKPDVNVF